MAHLGIFLLATMIGAVLCQNHCSVNEIIPETIFSSRTLYDAVRGRQIPSTEIEGCKPVAMWILMRNALTNPSPSELQEFAKLTELRDRILENREKWGSDELCNVDLEGMRNWSFNLDIARANALAEEGRSSIDEFVSRLNRQFPELINSTNSNDHLIRHTTAPTTKSTADAFANSLYKTHVPLTFVSDLTDYMETRCSSWVRNRQQANERARQFMESEPMKSIVQKIARRFGFNRLDFNLIKDAYRLCSFERALNSNSPWCSIFTVDELKAFEFEEDLLSYYAQGHGNPNSAKVGCSFLSTIIQNFEVYKFNHNVNVQVVRELSIRSVLVTLGVLGEDKPLSVENLQAERSWKNSQITPFLGNFVAVLHECRPGNVNYNMVSLYLNEKPLPLPWCDNSHVCNFMTFRSHLSSVINPNYCNRNHCNA